MIQSDVAPVRPADLLNNPQTLRLAAARMHEQLADAFVEASGSLVSIDRSPAIRDAVMEAFGSLQEVPAIIQHRVLSTPEACAWAALSDRLVGSLRGEAGPPKVVSAWESLEPDRSARAARLAGYLNRFAVAARRMHLSGDDPDALLDDAGEGTSEGYRVADSFALDLLDAVIASAPPAGADPDWEATLRAAFQQLLDWSPTFHEAGQAVLRLVLPWPAPSDAWYPHQIVEQHYSSGSVGFLPGLCWIARGASVLWTAEALVHEACHQVLRVIENEVDLILDEQGRGHSPWQPMPRSFRGILHGFFSFGHALSFLRHADCQSGLAAFERSYLQRRSKLLVAQLRVARRELAAAGLTDAGHQFTEDFAERIDLDEATSSEFAASVVRGRQLVQQSNAAETHADELLDFRVRCWIDQRIAATNLCPYATGSIDLDGTRIAILRGKRLADLIFDLAASSVSFLEARSGPYDCLVLVLPDLEPDELVALNAMRLEELIAFRGPESDLLKELDIKTRVFDPADRDSHRPPAPLWMLRAPTPDGR